MAAEVVVVVVVVVVVAEDMAVAGIRRAVAGTAQAVGTAPKAGTHRDRHTPPQHRIPSLRQRSLTHR